MSVKVKVIYEEGYEKRYAEAVLAACKKKTQSRTLGGIRTDSRTAAHAGAAVTAK